MLIQQFKCGTSSIYNSYIKTYGDTLCESPLPSDKIHGSLAEVIHVLR